MGEYLITVHHPTLTECLVLVSSFTDIETVTR